jgi:ribonucleoside-triphosphate reductase
MQPIYAKYYIRRVRYSENDPEVTKLRDRGVPLEPCVYTPGTVVASFPCEDPILTRVQEWLVEEQHEISIAAALDIQAAVQRYYVDNAISLTINLPEDHDSKDELDRALRKYLPHIKGTTVFPAASRPQSPIERISKEEYERLNAEIKPNGGIHSGESEQLLEECAGGACPIR